MPEPYIGGDPGASLWSGSLFSRLDALDHLLDRAAAKLPPLRALREETSLSASSLLLALFALALVFILPSLTERFLRRIQALSSNYRDEIIPNRYGVLLVFFAIPTLCLARYLFPQNASEYENGLLVALGFGGLGWLDDARGTKAYRGLRGHLRALLKDRTLTTGLIKAVGGLVLSGWIALRLSPETPADFCLDLLLIALSANAFNLLDLRPGRAAGLFLIASLLWTTFALLHPEIAALFPLILIVIPAARIWIPDAAAKVMLGDTGSNLLGAAFGLALAQSALPTGVKAVFVVTLLAFHLFAERYSLTKLIEGNRLLKWLDGALGVR